MAIREKSKVKSDVSVPASKNPPLVFVAEFTGTSDGVKVIGPVGNIGDH